MRQRSSIRASRELLQAAGESPVPPQRLKADGGGERPGAEDQCVRSMLEDLQQSLAFLTDAIVTNADPQVGVFVLSKFSISNDTRLNTKNQGNPKKPVFWRPSCCVLGK